MPSGAQPNAIGSNPGPIGGGGAGDGIYTPRPDSLVAMYDFSGDLLDTGPHGMDLTASGTPFEYTAGCGLGLPPPQGIPYGSRKCANLASGQTNIVGDSSPDFDPARIAGEITVQLWARIPAPTGGDAKLAVQGSSFGNDANAIMWGLGYNLNGIYYVQYGTSLHQVILPKADAKAWHYVAFTRNFAGTDVDIYVDGSLRKSVVLDAPTGGFFGSTGLLQVGTFNNSGWHDGAILGLRIDNEALTAEEIEENYARGAYGLAG